MPYKNVADSQGSTTECSLKRSNPKAIWSIAFSPHLEESAYYLVVLVRSWIAGNRADPMEGAVAGQIFCIEVCIMVYQHVDDIYLRSAAQLKSRGKILPGITWSTSTDEGCAPVRTIASPISYRSGK